LDSREGKKQKDGEDCGDSQSVLSPDIAMIRGRWTEWTEDVTEIGDMKRCIHADQRGRRNGITWYLDAAQIISECILQEHSMWM
jgi:hypothetical protein